MTRLRATFRSLRERNYRLYVMGNAVSVTGDWMQRIGQVWLVLELTDSATLLGVTAALQHLPTLLVGPWGGLLADRIDKRHLLMWTQTVAGALALALGVLVLTDVVVLWMVLTFAFLSGSMTALERPAKHSFVAEMVPADDVANAVTLNSVVFNAAKAVGPAIAGVIIAAVGLEWSFFGNAASFFCVVGVFALMRASELYPTVLAPRARGQLREGLRYVRGTPVLVGSLMLMTVSGMLAYEWAVTLPLLARDVFNGGAETYGLMFSAMGGGAVIGGLVVASSLDASLRTLLISAWVFGALMLVTVAAPSLPIALIVLFVLGGASIALRATATALLQLQAAPEFRGRTLALLGIAISGSTVLGGPLVGWIGETAGVRAALALGGAGTIVAALLAGRYVKRRGVTPPPGGRVGSGGSPLETFPARVGGS